MAGQALRPEPAHGLEARALAIHLHPEVGGVRRDVQRESLARTHARVTRVAVDHGVPQPSRMCRM